MKGIVLTALLCVGAARAGDTTRPAKAFPKTSFFLPKAEGMTLDWVLPPLEQTEKEKAGTAMAGFDVDAAGNPWFGDGTRRYFQSVKQNLFFRTMTQFDDFAFVDGKDLVACDSKYLLAPTLSTKEPKQEGGVSVMDMVALAKLDLGDCRLFQGPPGMLYLVQRDAKRGRDEVSLIDPHAEGAGKVKRLFAAPGRIIALAGDGTTTYYAQGERVWRFDAGGSEAQLFYRAAETVRGLAYAEKTGLFCATAKRVGFVSPVFQMNFITSPDPQIALRGTDLYIRLSRSLAVIKVERVDEFKTMTWANEKNPGAPAEEGAKKD